MLTPVPVPPRGGLSGMAMTLDETSSPQPDPSASDRRRRFDLLEASPYAHIAYTLDMVILDLNWRHARMTGVPREAAVGRDVYDVFPPNPDEPEADARPAMAASLERMVATREPDDMDVIKHDLPAPGGGFRERYWQLTHSPIFEGPDGAGRIVGALQTTRDVTAEVARRKIAAAQRRAAHGGGKLTFFELDMATDAVAASDAVDLLHGYAPGKADRHVSHYFARVHEDDREGAIAAMEGLRDAPDATEGGHEYRIAWPDGTTRWVSAQFEVVRGVEGETPKITGTVLDITDLRQREAELREAVAARDVLLAELNHRVKNSLQLVTSVLNMEAAGAERAGEDVAGRLRAAAARVGAIATVHATLYHGEDVRSVEFGAFLDTLCRNLAAAAGAEARGIAVTVEAEPVRVPTDRAIALSLVVNELVTNAFKHAFPEGRGGTVRVALRREGTDRIALEVADDGTGTGGGGLEGDVVASGGLGQRLVDALARQLGAEMRCDDDGAGFGVRLVSPV